MRVRAGFRSGGKAGCAVLRALTLGFFALKLGTLAVNTVRFPRLRPSAPDPAGRRRVSVLVPARDEAHNLAHTLPPLLAQEAAEVLVLDDGSRDGTAALARQLGARVLTGQPLPPGWAGKPWACWQLAAAAHGDVLVFTDADVTWQPGALDAVLAELDASGAGLLSVFPRQDNRTLGERLLTPAVDTTLLSLLAAPLLEVPHPEASAANGQVMVFRRSAYAAVDGHRSVRAELLEDVMLGRRVKAAGERLGLALGRDLIGVRMYRSYPQSVRGFAKSILPMHGGRRSLLAANAAWQLLAYTWPALRGQRLLPALALAEALWVRALTGRTAPADLAESLLTPAVPLLNLPVVWLASQRQVEWKGRRYPARAEAPSAAVPPCPEGPDPGRRSPAEP